MIFPKRLLVIIAAVVVGIAILVGAVVGCAVFVWRSSFELHPVGATATFSESADCLVRYSNNYKGWKLDETGVDFCFATQTPAKTRVLIACFNKYEEDHPGHQGWPEDNMRGCRWDGLTAVPAPHVVSLVFGNVVAVPAGPRAGERFVLTVGVTRSDSNAKPGDTTIETEPTLDVGVTLDGEAVVTTPLTDFEYGFFPDGKIHVTLTVPKAAEGKRLTIKMTIEADTAAATMIESFTVGR